MNELTMIALLFPVYIGLIILGGATVYNIYRYNREARERFEIQMSMAEAQQKMTNPLTFDNCKSIINDVVNFYCVNEDIIRGYYLMTAEELSLILDSVHQDICVMVVSNLSDEVKRQMSKFVTANDTDEDYLTYYVLHTVQILLQDEIRRRRQLTNTGASLVNRTTPPPQSNNTQRNANGVRTMSSPPQQQK